MEKNRQNLRHVALQKLFGLYVESVSKWLRIGHTKGVYIRETIIPGTPGKVLHDIGKKHKCVFVLENLGTFPSVITPFTVS